MMQEMERFECLMLLALKVEKGIWVKENRKLLEPEKDKETNLP